jgi:hypothetical protein
VRSLIWTLLVWIKREQRARLSAPPPLLLLLLLLRAV